MRNGRGIYVEQEGSLVGDLYRELFWDPEIDPYFFSMVRTDDLRKRLSQSVLDSPNLEHCDATIEAFYAGLVEQMIDIDVQRNVFNPSVAYLAKKLGKLDYMRERYMPVVESLEAAKNPVASHIAEALQM
jgi:hypothetical protein